jgi:L-lysine exporter family protein LysE/ArgO
MRMSARTSIVFRQLERQGSPGLASWVSAAAQSMPAPVRAVLSSDPVTRPETKSRIKGGGLLVSMTKDTGFRPLILLGLTCASGASVVILLAWALMHSVAVFGGNDVTAPPSGLLSGFILGIGFAASVGPQNLYLIRAGLARRHLVPVVGVGLGSELVLLAFSASAAGSVMLAFETIRPMVVAFGAVFLLWSGLRTFAQHNRHGVDHLATGPETFAQAVAHMLLVTWCNPLGYLKWAIFASVMLAQSSDADRLWCCLGLGLASALKFVVWPMLGQVLGRMLRRQNSRIWFNRLSGTALIGSAMFTFGQI